MHKVLVIAGKEMRQSFTTPMAYVVIAGFMIISGFFFFSLVQRYNEIIGQAAFYPNFTPSLNLLVIVPYYHTLQVILLFVTPLLSMRLLAEERRSGTFEMLATSPLSASEISMGKLLGVFAVISVMVALSFVYPFVLIAVADPEVPPIVVGALGILLFAWSCVSLGLGLSSFGKSQTLAGFVTLVFLLLLYVIDAQAGRFGPDWASVLHYLSPAEHLELFLKGVITSQDVVYFLSLILVGLFISNRVLECERWR